jgi:hypothetical protein
MHSKLRSIDPPNGQCVTYSREAELRGASLVFLAMPDIKELHAMIGQQAREIYFLPAGSIASAIRAQTDDWP